MNQITEMLQAAEDPVPLDKLTDKDRGRYRIDVLTVTASSGPRKMNMELSVYLAGSNNDINLDESCHICPENDVPPGMRKGCGKPIHPQYNMGGVFSCPHCHLTGSSMILSERKLALNVTTDKAAQILHDLWVRCDRSACIYLHRPHYRQVGVRKLQKEGLVGKAEERRQMIREKTDRVLYHYASIMRDSLEGQDMAVKFKQFLRA